MASRTITIKLLILLMFVSGNAAAQENQRTATDSNGVPSIGPVDPPLNAPALHANDDSGFLSDRTTESSSGVDSYEHPDTSGPIEGDDTIDAANGMNGQTSAATMAVDPTAAVEHTIETTPEPAIRKTSGDFNYTIPVNIPSFHGLQPNLQLAYSSSNAPVGRPNAMLGVGWRLNGFSIIERNSVGGGVATYENNRDIYKLDDTTLLSCPGGSVSPYPAEYIAKNFSGNNKSASCANGGDLTSQREDFRKIVRVPVTHPNAVGASIYNFWVYGKDGRRYVYKSIGELASIDPIANTDPRFAAVFGRRFLLTEVSDSQTNASGVHTNVVTYTYAFGAIGDGLPERPLEISYGGYKVKFSYQFWGAENESRPLRTYGVGNSAMFGGQAGIMRSIQIWDGNTKIRAYALSYIDGELIKSTKKLVKVQELGAKFSIASGTGEASVPNGELAMPPTTMTYSDDVPEFDLVTHSGTRFHNSPIFSDLEPDGRSEIIFPAYPGSIANGFASTYYFSPSASAPSSSSLVSIPKSTFELPMAGKRYPLYLVPKRQSAANRNYIWDPLSCTIVLPPVCIGYIPKLILFAADGASSIAHLDIVGPDSYPNLPAFLTELDGDLHPEALISNQSFVLDLDWAGPSSQTWPESIPLVGLDSRFSNFLGDFDGNGLSDWWWSDNIHSTMFPSTNSARVKVSHQSSLDDGPEDNPTVLTKTGDVNGDGLEDIIRIHFRPDRDLPQKILVLRSNGYSFDTEQVWYYDNWDSVGLGDFNNRTTVTDINRDGLADIVVSRGIEHPEAAAPKGVVFLNTGAKFVRPGELDPPYNISLDIPTFIGAADINGDGLPELVSHSSSDAGVIRYSKGLPANLLISVTTPLGASYAVTYAPTSEGFGNDPIVTDDRMPGPVRQVVASISSNDGFDNISTVSYRYAGGRFDEVERTSLGFTTVREFLPAINGEGSGPVRTVVHDTTSFATAGDVLSDKLETEPGSSSNVVLTRDIYDYDPPAGSGHGPFKHLRTSERTATHFGGALFETRRLVTYNAFGEVTTLTDLGKTNPATGADVVPNASGNAGTDNTITTIGYVPNLTSNIDPNLAIYRVDLPAYRRVETGTTSNGTVGPTWLSMEYLRYDGASTWNAAPIEGNLTKRLVWLGDTTNTNSRSVGTWTHDDFGNVLTEMTARGQNASPSYFTSFSYDGSKHLFRVGVTNALSQVTETTVWNEACQAPSQTADINGLTTVFEYDDLCRETKQTLANGQYFGTAYTDFGDPDNQSVSRSQKSPALNANGGAVVATSRHHFDGYGRPWKLVEPGSYALAGSTTVTNIDIVTTRAYDQRGNLRTLANPTYANGVVTPGAGAEAPGSVTHDFDGLDRLVRVTYPAGAKRELSYDLTYMDPYDTGTASSYPTVTSRDELCFDATSAGTLCGKTADVSDERGRTVRKIAFSGSDPDPTTRQTTKFSFDQLGRLIGVLDPEGFAWAYTYDVFGNRLTSLDPGLGSWTARQVWTMGYDLNGNLVSQVDTKGNTIDFTYDKLDRPLTKVVTDLQTGATVRTNYIYDQVQPGFFNLGRLTQLAVSAPRTSGSYVWVDTITSNYDNGGQLATRSHLVDGQTLQITNVYAKDGTTLIRQEVPAVPGEVPSSSSTPRTTAGSGTLAFDVAGRLLSYDKVVAGAPSALVSSINYDAWGNPLEAHFGNGAKDISTHNTGRNWVNTVKSYPSNTPMSGFVRNTYDRDASGRIRTLTLEPNSPDGAGENPGSLSFAYDYAGRLLSATPLSSTATSFAQTFSYDAAGRMTSNSRVGDYTYLPASKPAHAPNRIRATGTSTVLWTLTYDDNGNMTAGIDGKVMTYDGENRPLSVTVPGVAVTSYMYGADGARLKKTVHKLNCTSNCTDHTTFYFDTVEIQNWKEAAAEKIFVHLIPRVRLAFTTIGSNAFSYTVLHRDALGSVRGVTGGADGRKDEVRLFPPFGTFDMASESFDFDAAITDESKRYIGERFDIEAGLQYLNARYYDSKLGLFVQPDWWSVADPDVGTNRFAYALSDPINGSDSSGHTCGTPGPYAPTIGCTGDLWHDLFASTINTVTSDLSNALTSPLWEAGAMLAPHEGTITNAVMTTPFPHDNLAIAPLNWGIRLGERALARRQPIGLVAAAKIGEEASTVSNRIRGLAAEARVLEDMGLPSRNSTAVFTHEGRAIPDALTDDLLVEIKDAIYVSMTKQLRIEALAAKTSGRASYLVVGERTCVSVNCFRNFDTVLRRADLGPQ